jgi:very-short-patch-repair endonuclease
MAGKTGGILWRDNLPLPVKSPSPKGRGDLGKEMTYQPNFRGDYPYPTLTHFAREMRKQPTDAEKVLWGALRKHKFQGLHFRRQHQIGNTIADFYCHEKRLVVEVDGPVHLSPERQNADRVKNEYLDFAGMKVVRIQNEEVLGDLEGVLKKIGKAMFLPPLVKTTLPQGERDC